MFGTKKTTRTATDAGWFPVADMAAAFGMTSQGFHKQVRPLIDPADVRGEGKSLRIRCRGAIDAHAQKLVAQAVEKTRKEADPLLSGADSPALEEYRRHRAALAELDLLERRRELAPLAKLWPTLERFASLIRRSGEALQRRFGPDAAEILNDAIDQAEQAILSEREAEPK